MLKLVKSTISAILITVIVCTFALTASANPVTIDDYNAVNTLQKNYYLGTYVPCYKSYLQSLRDFRKQIRETKFETKEQAVRVLGFLNELRARHVDFYGTRETVGKSRFDVPAARVAMYKAADDDKEFSLAIEYCNTLKTLVEARVAFLNSIKNEINDFDLITTTPPEDPEDPDIDATVVFTATDIWSTSSFGFEIVISNNTNSDLDDWILDFDMIGSTINTVWIDGGAMKLKTKDGNVSITPQNKNQNGYTIPANGSVVLKGNANGNADDVILSNSFLNWVNVSMSYIK